MARSSRGQRRRAVSDDSDESDDSGGSKRRRIDYSSDANGNANGSLDANGSPDDNDSLDSGRSTDNGDGFQPGAIVRVKMENFVTYERAEFFPGPHLNMVIGPNGTGKSSLVCAICLGLGFAARQLGRSPNAREYVKYGKDSATIEIELFKRPQDRRNTVVRSQINREQSSQRWWLNGKEATHKSVLTLVQSFKIQVDNLCQFLPQDRVVEFAASTPVDLLRETLRAAAPAEMLEWQRELQDLHKDKKEIAQAAHADKDMLANLESRQQGLQADVDRIRERQEIQDRIKDLRGAHVVAEYTEVREQFRDARQREKEAHRLLKKLKEESGPSLLAINEKKQYKAKVDAAIPALERALQNAGREARKAVTEVNSAVDRLKETRNQIETEKRGLQSKKKELSATNAKITQIKADLKVRQPDFNAADWNQKIRGKQHSRRELQAEQEQASNDRQQLAHRGREAQTKINRIKTELESLKTQQGQQLAWMKKQRDYQEAVVGWEWVQQNQGEFEKEILGPPMISCCIKDTRYSDQVQSLLQKGDMACFTAQTKNDFKKLSDKLYRQLNLSVVIRSCQTPLESFQPPVDAAEAAQLGLDGFALSYMEGPAPVLAMLCAERRIHQAGVSLQEHTDAQYERLVQGEKINRWAAGKHLYSVVRRREYGPKAMTTVSSQIGRGKFWTSQPVGAQEKAKLEAELVEFQGTYAALSAENKKLREKGDAIEQQIAEIADEIRKLQSDKDALQIEYQKWQSLPEKLETEENRKKLHEQAIEEINASIQELDGKLIEAAFKRTRMALQHAHALDKLQEADLALVEARVMAIEALSDVEGLTQRNAGIVERLQLEKNNVETASKDVEVARARGKEVGDRANEAMQGLDEDARAAIQQLANGKQPDEIQWEISAEQAKLELIHTANPNAIRDYERRAREIDKLRAKMEEVNSQIQDLDGKLEGLMGKWEPRLDELVSRINDAFAYNFEQINCAGEIRVHKDDDFDQWALVIMVKFRENETLQQLTAHRQSGGERAVSTIFFLMALQSMAQAPFRVVDEINQGMDPRNERMVHERMVEIACRQHTSQYFLITPKLLSGLRYHERMRVLCIASGEHMPREGAKLDFGRCLALQKKLLAA